MGVKRALPTEAEIGVLVALAAQREVLSANTASGVHPFRAWLRFVDPDRQYLVLQRSGDAAADAALLALPRVDLLVEWGEWRIAFVGERPEAMVHEGTEAIRLTFPESVSISRRRMLVRATVQGIAALRCIAHSGTSMLFDAAVTDVSEGGIGLQLDSAGDALRLGTVIADCRIERPGRKPVIVDLEVRHVSASTLADGRRVVRAGCRFARFSPAAMELVAEFFRKDEPRT